jgi:hypothetical protein
LRVAAQCLAAAQIIEELIQLAKDIPLALVRVPARWPVDAVS